MMGATIAHIRSETNKQSKQWVSLCERVPKKANKVMIAVFGTQAVLFPLITLKRVNDYYSIIIETF